MGGKHLETLCSYGCILYTIRCPWFHLPLLICTPLRSTASPYELQESAPRLANFALVNRRLYATSPRALNQTFHSSHGNYLVTESN